MNLDEYFFIHLEKIMYCAILITDMYTMCVFLVLKPLADSINIMDAGRPTVPVIRDFTTTCTCKHAQCMSLAYLSVCGYTGQQWHGYSRQPYARG